MAICKITEVSNKCREAIAIMVICIIRGGQFLRATRGPVPSIFWSEILFETRAFFFLERGTAIGPHLCPNIHCQQPTTANFLVACAERTASGIHDPFSHGLLAVGLYRYSVLTDEV